MAYRKAAAGGKKIGGQQFLRLVRVRQVNLAKDLVAASRDPCREFHARICARRLVRSLNPARSARLRIEESACWRAWAAVWLLVWSWSSSSSASRAAKLRPRCFASEGRVRMDCTASAERPVALR